MNSGAFQPNAFGNREEMRSSFSVSDRSQTVVCPKARRIGFLNPTIRDYRPVSSLRWHVSQQVGGCELEADNDILEIILTKDGCGVEQVGTRLASSPPFFSGSPPSRVSNPLTQDARFTDNLNITQLSPLSPIPKSSTRKGSCVRGNFVNSPAVRIEGFDCLDRDRRNCSIPALA